MIETLHIVQAILTDGFTVGSIAGLAVLECSILDGFFMVYDKVVRGIGVFDY